MSRYIRYKPYLLAIGNCFETHTPQSFETNTIGGVLPPIISLTPSMHPNSPERGVAVYDLEMKIVRHASPTLAGIKPANLFTYRSANFTKAQTRSAIAEVSARLAGFGIRIEPIAHRTKGVLLLIARPALIEDAINNDDARTILARGNYGDFSPEGLIAEMKRRILVADASRTARSSANPNVKPTPKPERFVPCCATGKHHDHGPNHVCQCRAKAALSREELETTQGESGFPHEIGLILGYPPADVAGFIEHKGTDFLACGGWKAYSKPHEALDAFQRNRQCAEEYREFYAQGAPLEALAQARSDTAVSIFDMARAAV